MLLVQTYVDKSTIEGLGLFTGEDIKKGSRIWEYNSLFDKKITDKDLKKLPPIAQDFVRKYAYYNLAINSYILGSDHDRFFNYSLTPNTISDTKTLIEGETVIVASRDIKAGEELTADYLSFDDRVYEKLSFN